MTLVFSIIGAFLLYQFFIASPKTQADWTSETKLLPVIEISNLKVNIKNLRNFEFNENKILTLNYKDQAFDLEKLEKVWIVTKPLKSFNLLSDSYLVFDFSDQPPIALKVEPRQEINEVSENGNLKDFLWSNINKYELAYIWSTEKDAFESKSVENPQNIYMYPLELKKEDSQKLFLEFAQKTQALEAAPIFYNLFLRSFNSEFARAASVIQPNMDPSHYSLYLSNHFSEYLYQLGLIPNTSSFKDLTSKSDIFKFREVVKDPNFSEKLRQYLKV